ncbi:MAG: hypothetical protein J6K32_12945 [Clostridia bacterium]|nr:hypothetical protein [Clostridia bacterium]
MAQLGEAVRYASEKYGAASTQTTRYVVAQNKAKEAVAKLEKQLKETDRELEELGDDSRKVGRELERGIGESAEDVTDKLDDMMGDIDSQLSSIGGSVRISAFVDVTKNIIDGIQGIQEETEEYRRNVSYLEQAAKDAGQNWSLVEEHLFRVAANTGNLDEATEGLANLLAAGLDSKETADAVNLLLGAVTKFPETYKFEGLAESLRNTIEEGKAVGQYGELLLALGVDIEAFNKAMEKATNKEARTDLALSFGANRGLENTIAEYERTNELMLQANENTLLYQASLATLAEQMTPIGSAYTEMATATVQAISTLLTETGLDEAVVNVINGLTEGIKQIDSLITEMKQRAKEQQEEAERQEEIIEEETGLYSDLYEINQKIAELDKAGRYWDAEPLLKERARIRAEIQAMTEEMDFGDEANEAKKTGEAAGESLVDGMEAALEDGVPAMEEAGEELANGVSTGMEEAAVAAAEGAASIQSSIDSIDATHAINQMNAAAYAAWQLQRMQNSFGGKSGIGEQTMQISLNIDGRRFATATAPYMNRELGRMSG